jgi:hypothetical protein
VREGNGTEREREVMSIIEDTLFNGLWNWEKVDVWAGVEVGRKGNDDE